MTGLHLVPPLPDEPAVWASTYRVARAVTCPLCKAVPGEHCKSTGGGNFAYVPTHKAREARVAHWTRQQLAEAEVVLADVDRSGTWLRAAPGAFDACEAIAAPIVAKPAKSPTPKGVRLSEVQAEEIERTAERGGTTSASTVHFHGDAAHRQTVQALEAKGILRYVENTRDGYDRLYELTEFGWQVYRQHRLIIRR